MSADDGVQPLTVGGRHVLYIAHVLEPPLYLERGGTSLGQRLKVLQLVHVAKRQQVTVVLYNMTISVDKVEGHTAELRTLAAVGRTSETVLRSIAQAAVADAEGTVDKDLELDIGHSLVDGTNLVDRQLTRQHHTTKAQTAQPTHLLGRTVVSLRAGVKA